MDDLGVQLRQARIEAGVTLASIATRTCYSASHLSNVEAGRRTATPDIVLAYARALGEADVRRRDLLAAATIGPIAANELIRNGFTAALAGHRDSTDRWRDRVDQYGRDYMEIGADSLQTRLASDLVVMQQQLDNPAMWATAARALTTYGKTTKDPTEAIGLVRHRPGRRRPLRRPRRPCLGTRSSRHRSGLRGRRTPRRTALRGRSHRIV